MGQNNNLKSNTVKDCGPEPFIANLNKLTMENTNYRTTLWTGPNLQLTMMCIPVGGEIGLEVHKCNDQFLNIVSGKGICVMGHCRNCLSFKHCISDGCAVFVPAGTWHNIINTGDCPLKVYTIYAPPHHPHGTVHATKAIADKQGD